MNIKVLSAAKTICENRNNIHNYFGWPSVGKLPDGTLAMVASGFRVGHVCPFGKVVICYSRDRGESWTPPAVVLDTPLDDRDGGIAVQPDGTVLVTSFNNRVADQRRFLAEGWITSPPIRSYIEKYLDYLDTTDAEEKFLGSTFVISRDGGYTFGEFGKISVTAPHGPAPAGDGSFLYVGKRPSFGDPMRNKGKTDIACYRLFSDGTYAFVSDIPNVTDEKDVVSSEPYAIILPSGKIVVHIRVERGGDNKLYTIYQSESTDGGKTFTTPHRVLDTLGGAPAHLFRHSSGTVVSVYGHRESPYGLRAMFSTDDGNSWDTDNVISDNGLSGDLGYPCSVELDDGSILTVFYEHVHENAPAVIRQMIWEFTD